MLIYPYLYINIIVMQQIITNLEQELQKALDYLHKEYAGLQIGRASTGLVEMLDVEAYGATQPLKNMANISCPDSKTIQVQPWDKNVMGNVEKAIRDSDLGLNPVNNGTVLLITIPPLTEERRKDLVKIVHKEAEEAKVAVRQARHNAINKLKNMEKEKEISEDELKAEEKKVQEKVDEFNKKIEEDAKHKDNEVMSV